jgi:hypothetical protein
MTTIVTKNGSGAPLASDLVQGELAVDLTNKRLYTEDSGGTVIEVGTNPSTIDINAGTIDGTVIGGSSAAAGTFTTFTSTGIDDNATSTAITIDSSENVGINNTSPSSYYATDLVVGAAGEGGITIASTATTVAGYLMFADGTSGDERFRGYISYGHNTDLLGLRSAGDIQFLSGGSTERMRIDSSGNVGIGTTSPNASLHISQNPAVLALGSTHSSDPRLDFYDQGTTTIGASIFLDQSEDILCLLRTASGSATDGIRIDSSGNLRVGTPSQINSTKTGIFASSTTNCLGLQNTNNNNYLITALNSSSTEVFRVAGDGDVVNTNNSYGAISDERLKSNIVDASSQIDDIMAVQVRSYTLDSTGDTHIGVVAQELEASGMSGLVQTDKEGMKSVKYSVLYMKAIKALQEAVTRIETLEAEVAALKGA